MIRSIACDRLHVAQTQEFFLNHFQILRLRYVVFFSLMKELI